MDLTCAKSHPLVQAAKEGDLAKVQQHLAGASPQVVTEAMLEAAFAGQECPDPLMDAFFAISEDPAVRAECSQVIARVHARSQLAHMLGVSRLRVMYTDEWLAAASNGVVIKEPVLLCQKQEAPQ